MSPLELSVFPDTSGLTFPVVVSSPVRGAVDVFVPTLMSPLILSSE